MNKLYYLVITIIISFLLTTTFSNALFSDRITLENQSKVVGQNNFDFNTIPDVNFRRCINNKYLLRGYSAEKITLQDMMTLNNAISEVNCQSVGISNINGIEYLTNLTKLNLANNQISKVGILNKNVKLTYVNMQDQNIDKEIIVDSYENKDILAIQSDLASSPLLTISTTKADFNNGVAVYEDTWCTTSNFIFSGKYKVTIKLSKIVKENLN